MSRAQKYRLQFAACRGDRLLFFCAAAVALHAGAVTAVLLWQHSYVATQTAEQRVEPLSIEFVYLEPEQPTASSESARRASTSSIAAGQQQLERPVSPGGLTEKTVQPLKVATAAPQKPVSAVPSPALTPVQATDAPPVAAEKKSLEPSPAPKPAQPTSVAPSPTVAPTLPSPSPSSPAVPSPAAAPSLPTPQPTVTPSMSPAPIMGEGLDSATNPNRDSEAALGSVDAAADRVRGEYVDRITLALTEHWQQFTTDATRESKVRFTIDRSGQLVDVQLLQASGSEAADRAALDAVQASAPFTPLPEQFAGDRLVVNFTFTHSVGTTP